jgi:CheY-like chemotaxis protein
MPKKILIVEDNEDSRELVLKVLRNKGYETVEAVDGEDALEKAVAENQTCMWISRPGWMVMKSQKAQEPGNSVSMCFTAHNERTGRRLLLQGLEDIFQSLLIFVMPDRKVVHKRREVYRWRRKVNTDRR